MQDTQKDAHVLQVTCTIKGVFLQPMGIAQQEKACMIKVLYLIVTIRKEKKEEGRKDTGDKCHSNGDG